MRSSFIVTLGLIGSLILGACSSSEETSAGRSNTNSAVATTTTTSNANAAPIAANGSNTAVLTNGAVVPQQSLDPNSVDAMAPGDVVPMPQQEKLKGKLARLQDSSGEKVDARELAMKNAKPAPDNSTFTSYLSDAGYEIRTFKNHPQLQRVEKRTESTGSQTLKVFLRNGNVIQVSPNSIPMLSNAPAATILAAAGLTPAQPKQPAAAGTGDKKAVN